MGETVFEQITKSPEVLAKFLKPYIDETILYDMYCEKICTKSEECAKRGCIIDDTDTEYMLKNLFLSDHETFMSDGKNKKINKYKKLRNFKILSVIFMINITIGCIFFTDYNMNKMLNRESTINKGIEFIQKNINCIEKILRNIDLNIKI